MSAPHVVVVGGGLAGLRAAVECADAGAAVTLLESRARLGGATWSKRHRRLGIEIDNGQHVFMRCCVRYRAFLERLGVADRVTLQRRLAVPVAEPGAAPVWIRSRALPSPAHLADSLLRFRPLAPRARLRAALTARAFGRLDPDDPALDDRPVADWLAERGESAESIGRLWDLLIRPTLNLPPARASLALAARVMRTGFLDDPRGADLGWSDVPLSRLHAEPAARALEGAGAVVKLRTRVDAIEPDGGEGPRVVVEGSGIAADAVVLATPHEAAARLLPPTSVVDASRLRFLGRSPIQNLHVVFDRCVLGLPLLAAVGSELQWIFDRTRASGLASGQYLTVSLSAGDEYVGLSNDALRGIFLPAFHALVPASRDARVLDFAVTCERAATFRQGPGTARLRPPPGRVDAGVFLAGAWTKTGWPDTMEGAVRSGEAAASAALRHAFARAAGRTPRRALGARR